MIGHSPAKVPPLGTVAPAANLCAVFRTAAAFAAACLSVAAAALAADPAPPSTQVWLINTRYAPGCGDLEAGLAKIRYSRLDESTGCGQWKDADAGEFQAAAAQTVPTTLLVHGNNSSESWALRHGFALYGAMKRQACGRPFRLVIWSWPADRIVRRNRPDVQMKVCRSDAEAYYIARVLPQLPRGMPLGLVGYSLGCRSLSGALHLLAGGPVAGRSLSSEARAAWSNGGPRPIRAMMLAPAMDAGWLEPGAPRGLAPLAVEKILVVANSRDRILKWYSRLYGRRGPEAMGYAGPSGTAGGKIDAYDVACEIGREHDYDRYQGSSPVLRNLAWYTFLADGAHE